MADRLTFTFLIALASIVLFACRDQDTPTNLIKEDTMVDIYVQMVKTDTMKADSTTGIEGKLSARASAILEQFGVTEQAFRETVQFYHREPARWKDFYEAVVKKLREEIDVKKEEPPALGAARRGGFRSHSGERSG